MNAHDEFVKLVEGYYGKYNEVQRRIVINHIADVPEYRLEAIFEYLVNTFSTMYKTPPAVKEITEAIENAREMERLALPDPMVSNAREHQQRAIAFQEAAQDAKKYLVNGEALDAVSLLMKATISKMKGVKNCPYQNKVSEIANEIDWPTSQAPSDESES